MVIPSKRSKSILPLGVVAAVALLALGGCGESAPATPPAPPPFVAQDVSVKLGEHGGNITLRTTSSGGFTLNGSPFQSGGTVTAENGNEYTLTLAGGTWSAAFKAPDPASVTLGISGASASLQRLEDGSYTLDGEPFSSGDVAKTPIGTQYRLTVDDDGAWTAVYAPPDPLSIPLGNSGNTASITKNENGRFAVDGTEFDPGNIVEVANGDRYRISLIDGAWQTLFVPQSVDVPLGDSGETVAVTRLENGAFEANGQMIRSGSLVSASNDSQYRLTLDPADGSWSARFVAGDATLVTLGASGETVALERQEDGSYLLRGQRFLSGETHTTNNGSVYRLTRLSGGDWNVEYIAPPPFPLPLGDSGDALIIQRHEDGTYRADGELVFDNKIHTATNGSRYRIRRVGEAWTQTYLPDPPEVVRLGTSGSSVTIVRREDGTYRADGTVFSGSAVFTATNQNEYRVSLVDGEWNVEFVAPEPVSVQLGDSGLSVHLTRNEDRSYTVAGRQTPVRDGDFYEASDGSRWRLILTGGEWRAEIPTVEVTLGNSGGTVTVVAKADDTYEVDGQPIMSGGTVERNGNRYVLTRSGERWTARYDPTRISVVLGTEGGILFLEKRENGTWENTETGTTFRSGRTVSGEDGNDYRVTVVDDEATAVQLDSQGVPIDPVEPGTTPGTDPTAPSTSPSSGTDRYHSDTDFGTTIGFRKPGSTTLSATQSGEQLVVDPGTNEISFDVSRLFASRLVTISETYVSQAQSDLQGLIAEVERFRDNNVYGSGAFTPDEHIRTGIGGTAAQAIWNRANVAMNKVFGDGKDPLGTLSRVDEDEVQDVLDDLNGAIAALSSVSSLQSEYSSSFEADTDASDYFEAALSKLRFGSTSNTRFGAFARRTGGTSAVDTSANWSQGVFAYSPLGQPSGSDIPNRGNAGYRGTTVAVGARTGEDPMVYSGTIELNVSFSTDRIDAEIANLVDEDGVRFEATPTGGSSLTEVEAIWLPTATIDSRGRFTVSGSNATLRFAAGRGRDSEIASSEFHGQFIDQSRSALGTWKLGGLLDGAYGADRTSTQTPSIPSVSDSGGVAETWVGDDRPDSEGYIDLDSDDDADTNAYLRLRGTSLHSSRRQTVAGERIVTKVRTELRRLQTELNKVIRDQNYTSPDGDRSGIWGKIVTQLDMVFGSGHNTFGTYPQDNNGDDDAQGRRDLSSAISALSGASSLRSALSEGNFFADATPGPDDADELYAAREHDLTVRFGETSKNYTRFGVWANTVHTAANVAGTHSTGVFAYSPVAQSNLTTALNFEATYVGDTLAVETSTEGQGTIYSGDFSLTVSWGSSPTVSALISDLRNVSGNSILEVGGSSVQHIILEGSTASGTGLIAISGSPSYAGLRFTDSRRRDEAISGGGLEGKFVGESIDGPLGVLGTWTVTLETGRSLNGAFGAELAP